MILVNSQKCLGMTYCSINSQVSRAIYIYIIKSYVKQYIINKTSDTNVSIEMFVHSNT